jgi:hypothetical protein
VEKRYQVFISSTFTDLKEERQAVLRGILELNHMPAGMELFPASDETAWQLICDVIDGSDYYVLVVGGRYGSLDDNGIGFTEKEYDYAKETRKPVIPLLHQNPDELPRAKTETSELNWAKLVSFRKKVEKNHTCMYWNNANELKSNLILALTAATKRQPAVGWIRADQVPSEASFGEMLSLKNRIAQLESEANAVQTRPPIGSEILSQGNDTFDVHVSFSFQLPADQFGANRQSYTATISPTWNAIFAAVAPTMITEAAEKSLKHVLHIHLETEVKKAFGDNKKFKNGNIYGIEISNEDIETCIVQLRALGLIHENERKRSVHDKGTYWSLTTYGNHVMVQLRAIKKDIEEEKLSKGEAKQKR